MPSRRLPKLLVAIALACLAFASAAQASLIISEFCDPRLNYLTDRFIEIYNAGGTAVDLDGWSVVAVGNTVDIFTWPLSGAIAPGQALVCGDATTVITFPVDFPLEGWSDSNSTWNGKVGDGARLVDAQGTVIDNVVVNGTYFENLDYVRNPDVVEPSLVHVPSQWTGTAVDYPTQGSPGMHNISGGLPPTVQAIRIDPAAPLAGDPVDVLADVYDNHATVVSVTARWGLAPDALNDEISMSLQSGITYRTDTPIPEQSAGVTVYYQIEATNDVPLTTISALQSYSLPLTVTLHDIQGEVAVSPYDGDVVLTGGVVTGVYGSLCTLQDGDGAWNGVWASVTPAPSVGDLLSVYARVAEAAIAGYGGTTTLTDVIVLQKVPAQPLPAAATVVTDDLDAEAYEGVLVTVADGACTDADLGGGEWAIDDGSGAGRVGVLDNAGHPTLGTQYAVTGCVVYSGSVFKVEPRGSADVVWVADTFAPLIASTAASDAEAVRVTFTEPVDETSAEMASNYTIDGLTVISATRLAAQPSVVALVVSPMSAGDYTLTVTGVADLHGNVIVTDVDTYTYSGYSPPPGYYDDAVGLQGEPLRAALHAIIDNHTEVSYTFLWTAFYTTDDRPDGTVWDMYSDVPGGTPPYVYEFGIDQAGDGSAEGSGYNREHSWPRAWFGGEVAPMNTDLFLIYPTDVYVNNARGDYPYGEVAVPEWTSLNGCRRGPCSYPGYAGIVFEPIDAYKGDFARTYFYMSTRYYTEDAAWPGSPMTDGCDLKLWALNMLMEWNESDPVSVKELERNEAVYAYQHNRNPYIDHPAWVETVFAPPTAVGDEVPAAALMVSVAPNPFNPRTTIRWDLPHVTSVDLRIYDATGRLVRQLVGGAVQPAGHHESAWDGRDDHGRSAAAGVYFGRLETDHDARTAKLVLVR